VRAHSSNTEQQQFPRQLGEAHDNNNTIILHGHTHTHTRTATNTHTTRTHAHKLRRTQHAVLRTHTIGDETLQ
jgi:hypothetical protein